MKRDDRPDLFWVEVPLMALLGGTIAFDRGLPLWGRLIAIVLTVVVVLGLLIQRRRGIRYDV